MPLDDCLKLIGKGKDSGVETERILKVNDLTYNEQFNYAINYIKTSKYNIVTFLPQNLFEQFQRLANFYFLVLMILQLIPQISSLTPLTTILPLFTVLTVTALKDAVDDIADLLLLATSEPHGLCYIETAELDGETNLKARQCLPETAELVDAVEGVEKQAESMGSFDGQINCEPPNNRLATFEGKLTWQDKTLALDNDKMLLRGCVLRNTKWCYGVVVFAGKDTKLMMNSGKTQFKRTSLDRFLNVLIIGIVIFLLSMCFICMIFCGIWEATTGQYYKVFLPWDKQVIKDTSDKNRGTNIALIAFLNFFSYAILLNTVVPISLYVSVEIIRLCHSWLINWDKEMYYGKNDVAARSRTTTLNEELGQIQYIFSDKTGTLTQNIMAFNKCSIYGRLYGDLLDENGQIVEITEDTKKVDFSANPYHEEKFTFYDWKLYNDAQRKDAEVCLFWRLIALCHTVMPDTKNDRLEYQAQSPDEGALVGAARNFGFVFKSRTPKSITIEVDGHEETYDLLCILDFNNVRKRMSVLDDSLDKFAGEGLRTLCLATKHIDQKFYDDWSKRQHEASVALDNRQEQLDQIYEEIEQGIRSWFILFRQTC